jgi:hypothetical protein
MLLVNQRVLTPLISPANSRKPEPQQLGALLVHVLAKLGVTTEEPKVHSEMLEAPVDEAKRE